MGIEHYIDDLSRELINFFFYRGAFRPLPVKVKLRGRLFSLYDLKELGINIVINYSNKKNEIFFWNRFLVNSVEMSLCALDIPEIQKMHLYKVVKVLI